MLSRLSSSAATVSVSRVWNREIVRIAINDFIQDTTYLELLEKLPMVASYDTIIVDVSNNKGGNIDETNSIIEAFLPAGIPYIQARERQYDEINRTARTLEWHPWTTSKPARPELAGKIFFVEMSHYLQRHID